MIELAYLEEQKSRLLKSVDGWSSTRLGYRPSPTSWSAVEVFDHLVKSEERILEAARLGPAKPHRIGPTDRIRTRFLCKVFESDRRVKVPASATVVMPDKEPNLELVCRRWNAVRDDLGTFQGQLSPEQMRQGIFKHPVGGWMALEDVVEFFSVHMVHHTFQLDRLSAESRSL